ncbi:MAG TPA: YbaK/EbsC family protein [Chloroflexota bacterium]|nr:YbaK/EbsC family protein [Chloroflexota bacterium]
MARPRPPATLEALRALLDRASARRSFITGSVGPLPDGGAGRPVPQGTRCRAVIVEVDRDYLAAIIADGDRLDTGAVAAHLGATRARVTGPRLVRSWLGVADNPGMADGSAPLAWDEVPLITQLPTLLDAGLLGREFLLGGTGDSGCTLRIAPRELRRVTEAGTAAIAHRARVAALPEG